MKGAAANALPDPVPEEVKEARRERLMAAQARISANRLTRRFGSEMTVLVDEVGDDAVIARGPGDAPGIDGVVVIEGRWDLAPGDFVDVRVTGSDEHDLRAEPVGFE